MAVVVASLISVLQYATTWLFLANPCLHICVRGDRYPVAIPAVPLKRSWRQRDPASQPERRKSELREVLGDWLDRFPVVCPDGDLAAWWVGQERRPAIPNRVSKEPTSHERVEAVHHELEHLQHELDQINRRKKHDLPPPTQF